MYNCLHNLWLSETKEEDVVLWVCVLNNQTWSEIWSRVWEFDPVPPSEVQMRRKRFSWNKEQCLQSHLPKQPLSEWHIELISIFKMREQRQSGKQDKNARICRVQTPTVLETVATLYFFWDQRESQQGFNWVADVTSWVVDGKIPDSNKKLYEEKRDDWRSLKIYWYSIQ